MIALMAFVASSTDSKTPSIVRQPCGSRVRRTQTLVTMPKRPFAANDHAGQVESRGVLGRPAEVVTSEPSAITGFDAQHVIDGHAVLERVRSARIRGHIAADGAGPLARRVGSVVITASP